MKKKIDTAANTITFAFEGLDPVVFNPNNASRTNQNYAMFHGFCQRIGDNAASCKTEVERRNAILQLTDHYNSESDDWNVKAAERKAPQNPVIVAIANKLGITYEEAQAKVAEQFLAELA